jgi:hypothetical protein
MLMHMHMQALSTAHSLAPSEDALKSLRNARALMRRGAAGAGYTSRLAQPQVRPASAGHNWCTQMTAQTCRHLCAVLIPGLRAEFDSYQGWQQRYCSK